MKSAGSSRGGPAARRAARLLLPCLVAACQTTPLEEPTRSPPMLISATQFAGRLNLDRHTLDGSGRMALTNAGGVTEIVLFPETTVVSVRGRQCTTASTIELRGDEAWLTSDDASAIEMQWQAAPIATSPWREPSIRPIGGPATTQSGAATHPQTTPGPRGQYADAPTAEERRAWTVPLRMPWHYIVIHHSASDSGNAREFDAFHKSKGWDGLAYQFVIGNGTGSGDGAVEVGYRWREQKRGAHAGVDKYNEEGIGICLVGDFTKRRPTTGQMRALSRLCNFLSAYCRIPRENYCMHGDLKKTSCPGPLFPRDFLFAPHPSVGTK